MNGRRERRSPEKLVMRRLRRALIDLGFEVHDLTQPRQTMLPPGLPDYYVRHPAWKLRFWIEVKAGREQPSLYQKTWHAGEEAAGGRVVVVRSVDDIIRALTDLGAPIRAPQLDTTRYIR